VFEPSPVRHRSRVVRVDDRETAQRRERRAELREVEGARHDHHDDASHGSAFGADVSAIAAFGDARAPVALRVLRSSVMWRSSTILWAGLGWAGLADARRRWRAQRPQAAR
jgi:hypothetical protein